jgi:CHAT domain-containing protein
MKTCLNLSILILFFAKVSSQVDSLNNLMNQARGNSDFKEYYEALNELERLYIKKKDFLKIPSLSNSYDIIPSTSKDSIVYRKYLMLHGYRLKKYNSNIKEALSFYLNAHRHVIDKTLLDDQAWFTEKPIGTIYSILDDYDMALHFNKIVEDYLIRTNQIGKLGRLYSDMGDNYKWNEDYDMAVSYYSKGVIAGEESGNLKASLSNLESLSKYYLDIGLIEEYLELYNQIQKKLSQLEFDDSNIDRRATIKITHSDYLVHIKSYREAELSLLDAVGIYRERYQSTTVREIAKVYNKLSQLGIASDDLVMANTSYKEGMGWLINSFKGELPLRNQLSNENTFVDLLNTKSNIYQKLYEESNDKVYLDSALISLDISLEANEQLQNDLILLDSRLISVSLHKDICSEAISLCYKLWEKTDNDAYVTKAGNYASSSKAVILNDTRNRKKLVEQLGDASRLKIVDLESELLDVLAEKNKIPEYSVELESRYLELKNEIRELTNYSKLEHYIKYDNEDYIEYIWTTENLFSINNFSKEPFKKVPIQKIEELIDSLLIRIETQSNDKFESLSQNIAELILPKETDNLKYLRIIPDGKLLFVPFEMLKLKDKYLIEDIDIKYDFFNRKIESSSSVEDSHIFCLAPEYEGSEDIKGTRKGNSILKYAKEEIHGITNVWPGNVHTEESISFTELMRYSEDYNIFHYSGHAIGSGSTPELLLPENDPYSLDIELFEESNLGFDLVTLSACETGLGQFENGEGVRSMAYSFLSSGSDNIVYSLWAVNDMSSSQLMKLFYEELSKGKKVSNALKNAKLKYLKSSSPEGRHPYYWAGFVSVGDDRSFAKSDRSSFNYLIMASILILVIIFLFKTKAS